MKINLLVVIFFAFLALDFGCAQMVGKRGYDEIRRIPGVGSQLRRERFATYPIDQQIDIYLYSQYNVEGGGDEFFRYMADDGENKIPQILKRLDTDRDSDPRTKVGLIRVLDHIDQGCHCLLQVQDAGEILNRSEMQPVQSDSDGVRQFKELYRTVLERIKLREGQWPAT
jgi:hypothetical protein